MPTNLAADVDALERRLDAATSVDGVNVEKETLAALIEGWRNWQMVEAMPKGAVLRHVFAADDVWQVWSPLGSLEGRKCESPKPAAALAAAFGEEGSDGE